MRDYFMRHRDKKTTGLAAFPTHHILDDYVQSQTDEEESQFEHGQKETASEAQSATVSDRRSSSFSVCDDGTTSTICSTPQNARKKRNHTSAETTTDVLREFLQRKRPNPMKFIPPTPPQKCGVQQFFDSMATTVKTFPPLSIAKVKLQIANIVGEEEIACAERNASAIQTVQLINYEIVQPTESTLESVPSTPYTQSHQTCDTSETNFQ